MGAQKSSEKMEIHWSEGTTSVSPDQRWRLEVSPHGEDGPAIVSAQRTAGGKKYVLFRLRRDASIFWSPNSTSLMVEDRSFSDHSRLMLFHIPFLSQDEQGALLIDRTVKVVAERNLNPVEQINYYLPEVVGWKDGRWLVAVGITTIRGDSGPFTSHCFGYLVDDKSSAIAHTFSEAELKDKFGATCQ